MVRKGVIHLCLKLFVRLHRESCARLEFAREILRLAGKEDQLTVTVKEGAPEKYSVLDNMMLRLNGIEEPDDWKETLAAYMKETGGLE